MGPLPRKLILDLQVTQSPAFRDRGVGRYAIEFTRELLRRSDMVSQVVFNPVLPFPGWLDDEILSSPKLAWGTATNFRRARVAGADWYVVMSPFEDQPSDMVLPGHVAADGISTAVLLHDLIPLALPGIYLVNPARARAYRARLNLVRAAARVLTNSEHTRRDAIERLALTPERVVSIGTGVSKFFRTEQPEEAAATVTGDLGIVGEFALFVSGDDARKNTERLIAAYGRLPTSSRVNRQLVIVGDTGAATRSLWERAAFEVGLDPGSLVITGRISDWQLRALYQRTRLFVFPSLYEGFGLPVLEAAACGAPAITSDTSSLPEVLNMQEATFTPTDIGDLAASLSRALDDEPFRKRLRQAGQQAAKRSSWGLVADRAFAALASPTPTRSRKRRRLRIAFVGPTPPVSSGIARYNERLLPHLGEIAEVDLFATPGSHPRQIQAGGMIRRFQLTALGRQFNPGAYDGIVYCIGDSIHHANTLPLMLSYPGIAWFHDARLIDLYLALAKQEDGPEAAKAMITAKIRQFYPTRFSDSDAYDWATPERYAARGIAMATEVLRVARGIVVNSDWALRLLLQDAPSTGCLPPAAVIPLACPAVTMDDSRRDPNLIVSFGMVTPVKSPGTIVRALVAVRQHIPARLSFVGPAEDGISAQIARIAADLDVADYVSVTGEVGEAEYRDWLGRAGCAVQLRSRSSGESSAAVCDCLAAGVPTITNVWACSEIPAGSVRMIPSGPVDVSTLADELVTLLHDGDGRARQIAAARDYAAAHGFDVAAQSIVTFVKNKVVG